jgi:protein-tyrosine phosphatase
MVHTILAVCIGNICRSPMAEGFLRTQLPGVLVESAGISALNGQSADDLAIQLMAERGIDISWHRSRQLTSSLCRQADLILVMSEHQKLRIEFAHPFTRGRVYRLPQQDELDIADPYGMGPRHFEQCCEQIYHGAMAWSEQIRTALATDAPGTQARASRTLRASISSVGGESTDRPLTRT